MDSVGHSSSAVQNLVGRSGKKRTRIPDQRRTGKTRGRTRQRTLHSVGLHASRYTGTCMLLDMCHVCSLSESPTREGPARLEERPDSTSFTLLGLHASRYTGTCLVHATRHVFAQSEKDWQDQRKDRKVNPSFCWASMHPVTQEHA